MGPAAAADFYVRIVDSHGALRDQDHPPCILYSATQVPDRTAFLLDGGADPTAELVAAVRLLEAAGADFVAMPCNSAHAFLDAMRDAVAIPILDMVALAAAAVARVAPQASTIGLLATGGTVHTGLYGAPLQERGMEPLYPQAAVQQEVMAAIKDVKAGVMPAPGSSDDRLQSAAEHLSARGADCIIMACTEVPLALVARDSPVAVIDATEVLVEATLALAVGRLGLQEAGA